jgi:uncharacterized protein (DUF2252 family)
MNIVESTHEYERWLKTQLDGDIVRQDFAEKHDKMAEGVFPFLRATYWRWAETIFEVCPDLKGAPHVLAVGDIHLENFGTWRDGEGRLVWGVNDFDEAAGMPYALDIVRLATSAVLAKVPRISAATICANVLAGYREGIVDPKVYVLDRKHAWLRNKVIVTDKQRKKFWEKFDPKKAAAKRAASGKGPLAKAPPRYIKALEAARPDSDVTFSYMPRTAGAGSLGRPRFVGYGEWRGDTIVREAKAMVRSAWARAHHGSHKLHCEEIATGRHRCPDPWYALRGHILVRRLSPNNYKIEAQPKKKKKDAVRKTLKRSELVNAQMLYAMGHDIAAIHRGTPKRRKDILADLDMRDKKWLDAAVTAAVAAIEAEWKEWCIHHNSISKAKKKT